jgi:hypothetical protein
MDELHLNFPIAPKNKKTKDQDNTPDVYNKDEDEQDEESNAVVSRSHSPVLVKNLKKVRPRIQPCYEITTTEDQLTAEQLKVQSTINDRIEAGWSAVSTVDDLVKMANISMQAIKHTRALLQAPYGVKTESGAKKGFLEPLD